MALKTRWTVGELHWRRPQTWQACIWNQIGKYYIYIWFFFLLRKKEKKKKKKTLVYVPNKLVGSLVFFKTFELQISLLNILLEYFFLKLLFVNKWYNGRLENQTQSLCFLFDKQSFVFFHDANFRVSSFIIKVILHRVIHRTFLHKTEKKKKRERKLKTRERGEEEEEESKRNN